MKPTNNKVPRHIAIILDGNRRFAKRLMLKPWKGHDYGEKKVEKLLEWCKELRIEELTLYALSIENFSRPKKEFNYLMRIFEETFDKLKDDKRVEDIKINFIGRIWMLPQNIKEKIKDIEEKTKNNTPYKLNIALAYGGRAEIIDATKKISEEIKKGALDIDKINEDVFKKNLYMNSEPDLIRRTGGEKRISGFLLWQGSYAELFFIDKMWPEFEKEDFVKAIEEYNKRERRFGK